MERKFSWNALTENGRQKYQMLQKVNSLLQSNPKMEYLFQ